MTFPAEYWLVAYNPTTNESESVRRIEPIPTIDLGIRAAARQHAKQTKLYPLQPSPFGELRCYQWEVLAKHSSFNDCKLKQFNDSESTLSRQR